MALPKHAPTEHDELVVALATTLAQISATLPHWRTAARAARAIGLTRAEFVGLFAEMAARAWKDGR